MLTITESDNESMSDDEEHVGIDIGSETSEDAYADYSEGSGLIPPNQDGLGSL